MYRYVLLAAACLCTGCAAPHFAEAPCEFKIPSGAQVRCGWLRVPENWSKPSGRTIRLHVAIYKSRSLQPAPDPIVWLVGGPGGRAHFLSSNLFDRVVAPYLGRRDFIVLDIRGTGYSRPALDCPNPSGPASEWLAACRERLSAIADLACYNGAAVAADLDDLRRTLGYASGTCSANRTEPASPCWQCGTDRRGSGL